MALLSSLVLFLSLLDGGNGGGEDMQQRASGQTGGWPFAALWHMVTCSPCELHWHRVVHLSNLLTSTRSLLLQPHAKEANFQELDDVTFLC